MLGRDATGSSTASPSTRMAAKQSSFLASNGFARHGLLGCQFFVVLSIWIYAKKCKYRSQQHWNGSLLGSANAFHSAGLQLACCLQSDSDGASVRLLTPSTEPPMLYTIRCHTADCKGAGTIICKVSGWQALALLTVSRFLFRCRSKTRVSVRHDHCESRHRRQRLRGAFRKRRGVG